jgi:uncharacterized protein (TIGR03437 family)
LILTIRAALAELSFFNAASLEPGTISPAEVLAIYGTGLAPGVQGCVTANQAPLPWLLSGVQVRFTSGSYTAVAPLYSVCNLGTGQEYAVVQAPADLPLMDTTVTVQVGDTTVGQSRAPAAPASPGIFETVMSDGRKRAVLQRLDGSYVSLDTPAKAGERLRAFVTGLGSPVTASGVRLSTNQAGIAGDDAAPPNAVLIRLASRDVQPVSSIYSTDTIGVYVVTFDVPDDVQSGLDIDFMVGTLVGDQSVFGKSSKLPIQ